MYIYIILADLMSSLFLTSTIPPCVSAKEANTNQCDMHHDLYYPHIRITLVVDCFFEAVRHDKNSSRGP